MTPTTRSALATGTRRLVGLVLATSAATLGMAAVSPATAALPVPQPGVSFTGPPEAFARYVGQNTCDPVEKPGTTALRALLKATYGTANAAGTSRSCSSGGKSEHKEGRAYDWMNDVGDPVEKARADAFVSWAVNADAQGVIGGNARRLGIMYLIWNKRSWSAYDGGTWEPYTGSSPHTDHVHTSLSWDGAFKRTSWWTGRTLADYDYGPCALYIGEPAPRHTASTRNTSRCPNPIPRVGGVFAGDWDGDGDDELGTFRDGRFALTVNGRTVAFGFGTRGDIPVAGDWDADGDEEVGVFRKGQWHLRNTLSAGDADTSFAYGSGSDVPVTGVWTGYTEGIGVKRGSLWYLRPALSAGPHTIAFGFGRATDKALAGDWDGNGSDEPGVRRGKEWYLARSATRTTETTYLAFGGLAHTPVVGDWDGNDTDTSGTTYLLDAYWRNDHLGGNSTHTGSVPI